MADVGSHFARKRWLRTATALTVFLSLMNAIELVADEWYDIYKEGRSDLARGDWQQAIGKFQQALKKKPKPEAQAPTSGLTMVDYLPHYHLGQAYFYSGQYELALKSFQMSLSIGEIKKTSHLRHLEKSKEIVEALIAFANQQTAKREFDPSFEKKLDTLQDLLGKANDGRAQSLLKELQDSRPEDNRLPILASWFRNEQQRRLAQKESIADEESPAVVSFNVGLDYYLIGQYQQALDEFKFAAGLDPDFRAAGDWIRKTQAEMERLKLAIEESNKALPEPEIIERIVTHTTTTAPVFAIRSPTETMSEVRSRNLILSGQVGDDQGIAYIQITLNGQPLLNADGERILISPPTEEEAKRFPFSVSLPLQMGENQIVLTAYDVDSPPHRTPEQLSVIRKPPIYRTTTFGVSVGALVLLGIGGVFTSRVIKYRIAIVNKYNPYIAGSPIRTEEMFFGREKLLKRILNTLHNNSLMIYGPRRIGKTSLQHHLKRRLENSQDPEFRFIPVMIDLQGTSEDRFFATLMEEILEVCKAEVNGKVSFKLHENRQTYSGRDFSRDVKNLLQFLTKTTEKKLKLVLLMDEVDELNKYSEKVNQKLRSVFMKTFAEHLVAVMSGAYIRKSWESEGSPWYNFFEEIEVPPFQREDAIALIRKPVEGIFSYDDAAIERILASSECKPYIIQRICINVINRIIEDKRRRVTAADVEAVERQVLNLVDGQ